jgi:hypothetical protein
VCTVAIARIASPVSAENRNSHAMNGAHAPVTVRTKELVKKRTKINFLGVKKFKTTIILLKTGNFVMSKVAW